MGILHHKQRLYLCAVMLAPAAFPCCSFTMVAYSWQWVALHDWLSQCLCFLFLYHGIFIVSLATLKIYISQSFGKVVVPSFFSYATAVEMGVTSVATSYLAI